MLRQPQQEDHPMHIGLIGGIGPAATEYYYRGLLERYSRSGTALDLTIVHADVQEMARNLAKGAAQEQAEIFAHLIKRLAAAGAEVAAVTSMGGHFCIRELAAISPLPLLNAIPEVDATIRQRNLRTVGIIGTRSVMESGLYGGITSARTVTSEGAALDQVHDAYVSMATAGHVTETQRGVFFSIGHSLCQARGAEAIVLGGLPAGLCEMKAAIRPEFHDFALKFWKDYELDADQTKPFPTGEAIHPVMVFRALSAGGKRATGVPVAGGSHRGTFLAGLFGDASTLGGSENGVNWFRNLH
jgi:aspartate racemase